MYLPKYQFKKDLFSWFLAGFFMVITFPSAFASPQENQFEAEPANLIYESVFANYRYFADQPLQDWYQLNQTVDEIGGWRYYIQEPYKKPLKKPHADKSQQPADKKPMNHHHHHHGGAK